MATIYRPLLLSYMIGPDQNIFVDCSGVVIGIIGVVCWNGTQVKICLAGNLFIGIAGYRVS